MHNLEFGTEWLFGGPQGSVVRLLTEATPANPLFIAHRAANLRGYTFASDSFSAAYSSGVRVMEADCRLLSDNELALCHDADASAMTTGSGLISGMTASTWQSFSIDEHANTGGFSAQSPMTLAELLADFGNTVNYAIDAKDAAGISEILTDLEDAGIETGRAVVQVYDTSDLAAIKTAGYEDMVLLGPTDAASAETAGATWGAVGSHWSTTDIQDWVARLTYNMAWTVQRRYRWDELATLGLNGAWSDDPAYLAGVGTATSDSWGSSQRWMAGMLHHSEPADAGLSPGNRTAARRGEISADGYFGWDTFNSGAYPDNRDFVLQGWATDHDDVASDNYDVEFSAEFTAHYSSATEWLAIAINDDSVGDRGYPDSNTDASQAAYNLYIRKNGDMNIYRKDGTGGALVAGPVATSSIADGELVHFRAEVRPASITLHRLDASRGTATHTITTTDTTYRGGYFHFGRASMKGRFKDVFVTRY